MDSRRNHYYQFLCVCVCVCVCERERETERERERDRDVVFRSTLSRASLPMPYFLYFSRKREDFVFSVPISY
jgi:hypothetical protein